MSVTLLRKYITTAALVGSFSFVVASPSFGAERAKRAALLCDGCFAVLDAVGNVIADRGENPAAAGTGRVGVGVYRVRFQVAVDSDCAYLASLNDPGTTSGEITAEPATTPPFQTQTVVVRIFSSNGIAADHGFSLFLACT